MTHIFHHPIDPKTLIHLDLLNESPPHHTLTAMMKIKMLLSMRYSPEHSDAHAEEGNE
jgi:hypothetical protein